jgi:hypothetical protein
MPETRGDRIARLGCADNEKAMDRFGSVAVVYRFVEARL